jgi:hypothetical protein
MSDYARNQDTYNDGAAEEPCEDCGTYACICPLPQDEVRQEEENDEVYEGCEVCHNDRD